MADQKISALTAYTTPIGADVLPVVNSTSAAAKEITLSTLHAIYMNSSTASQGPGFATDTYLTHSNISIPSGAPYVGTTYKLVFDVTKTAVGTATPTIIVRIGTAGTTADAAICTIPFTVLTTAAIDTGLFEVIATFRTVGSGTSAVLQSIARLTNNLPTTGLSGTLAIKAKTITSSGFNSTTANLIIGASYNGGTSAVHTVTLVHAELIL